MVAEQKKRKCQKNFSSEIIQLNTPIKTSVNDSINRVRNGGLDLPKMFDQANYCSTFSNDVGPSSLT